jgi:hypothetical protein
MSRVQLARAAQAARVVQVAPLMDILRILDALRFTFAFIQALPMQLSTLILAQRERSSTPLLRLATIRIMLLVLLRYSSWITCFYLIISLSINICSEKI